MAGMTKEEAIKEIDERYRFWQKHYAPECEKYGEALGLAIEALSQPERPKGRWEEDMHTGVIGTIEFDTYFFRCSECGTGMFNKNNYCPNCGADMKDGEEE